MLLPLMIMMTGHLPKNCTFCLLVARGEEKNPDLERPVFGLDKNNVQLFGV